MSHRETQDATKRFIEALQGLLLRNGAEAAWLVGSRARGSAAPESDIDVIVVAPSARPFVDRGLDYLPALRDVGAAVDLLVYTPEEFHRMLDEERPFLCHALEGAVPIEVGAA